MTNGMFQFKDHRGGVLYDFKFGLGPILKASGIIYLAYLAVYKNIKIPPLFFLIIGIASLLYSNHFRNLSILHKDYLKIHKVKHLYYQPLFVDHIISGIVCILTAIYLYSK
uniref:Uncharacterized protein n=1 Tax=viral metagenome TaxID=1070528 RepID=A0A6C0HWP6_9ZZZZ